MQQPAVTDQRYTQIPRALIRMCTPREYQLVSALLGYRWREDSEIFPRIKTLADEMGCKVRTVQYALRGLEAKGLIVSEPYYRSDGGQSSNRYLIGPVLAPLLAPLPAHDCAASSAWMRPPVQDGAPRKKHPEQHNRTRGRQSQIPTTGSAYLETRRGQIQRR